MRRKRVTRSIFKDRKVANPRFRELRSICDQNQFFYYRPRAARAINFAHKHVKHVKGELAGKPFILEKWQRKILRRVFGWLYSDTGLRVVREVWIEVPRKNGKSFLGAFFALFLLFADKEEGAEVVSAAADTEQGALVYDVAKQIVIGDPKLNRLCRTYKKSMAVYQSASKYNVISAEAYTKHGKNLSGIIFDEVHAQPDRELVDVLTTSTSARRQPLTVFLTTAGYDRNSICFEKHEYARKLIEGLITDYSFYPVIYAAGDKDDWTKESTWFKANPNLGISKKLEYMRAECLKAQKEPSYENTFKRLELNIWTEQDVRWMPMNLWDECNGEFSIEDLLGATCNGGLDLSTTTDLTCFSLVFPSDSSLGCSFRVLPFFFLPEDIAKSNAYYRALMPYGEIITTPGNVLDYTFVEKKILELQERYNIIDVGYDPWNATQLSKRLEDRDVKMFPVRQGYASLSPPTKELMTLVRTKRIEHLGNRVLRWNASNVTVEQDAAGNIKPSKKKSTQRIDGIVATIIALDRALRNLDDSGTFSEEGIKFLG